MGAYRSSVFRKTDCVIGDGGISESEASSGG
jgi:hypothetical protein